jgi:pimeloyl-ACP methyl ester carboxylesterase
MPPTMVMSAACRRRGVAMLSPLGMGPLGSKRLAAVAISAPLCGNDKLQLRRRAMTLSQTVATALAVVVTASVAEAQLLLLHGGLGSIDIFGPDLPALAKNRQVIAVDLYGHGRTALTDRSISLVDMTKQSAPRQAATKAKARRAKKPALRPREDCASPYEKPS